MPKSVLALVKQVILDCGLFHPSATRKAVILPLGKGKKVFCFQAYNPKPISDIFKNACCQKGPVL